MWYLFLLKKLLISPRLQTTFHMVTKATLCWLKIHISFLSFNSLYKSKSTKLQEELSTILNSTLNLMYKV